MRSFKLRFLSTCFSLQFLATEVDAARVSAQLKRRLEETNHDMEPTPVSNCLSQIVLIYLQPICISSEFEFCKGQTSGRIVKSLKCWSELFCFCRQNQRPKRFTTTISSCMYINLTFLFRNNWQTIERSSSFSSFKTTA